jgi:outer membrane lipoprotein carrier protein
MKKLLSVCAVAILCAVQPAMAQDAKAKAVLDGVSKKAQSLKSFKANFAFTLTGNKVSDTKKGTIAIKGQKYHAIIGGQEVICDTKTVWSYNKETKEVQVSTYNPSEQSMSPAKLLTNFYDKEYNYAYQGEKKVAGKNCDVVLLTPKTAAQKVAKIELLVDKTSNMIAGGTYWEKNGNKYQYSISNFMPNANVSDAEFTWDAKAHPGVETVDLR